MKKDKSHGKDEADCRAKLILINGDNAPTIVLEKNGKPSSPGEVTTLSPECSQDVQGCTGLGILTACVPGPC